MIDADPSSWLALLALGAGHGINPGMGWLFAVALGLQQGTRRAVWSALLPLGLGHAAAIGAMLLAAIVVGAIIPPEVLRYVVACVLVGLGVWRFMRTRHVRFGGMQVNARELAVWSFLMASAHGAGLMVLPLVLPKRPPASPVHPSLPVHSAGLGIEAFPAFDDLLALVMHTVGYLAVTGIIAILVYERLGLRLLRTAWINVDMIWAVALILTGVATAVL